MPKIEVSAASITFTVRQNKQVSLKEYLLPEFDRGFAALVEDLAARGLLDSTLLLVTSEMGRRPKIGDPRSGGTGGAGRDHWTHCMSVLLAGGGIRGGQVYGASDATAAYPAADPVGPWDLGATVLHCAGIDPAMEIRDPQGRPVRVCRGEPIAGLL